jgi:RNA polymerase sigma-70 factor (ECF subfamily)
VPKVNTELDEPRLLADVAHVFRVAYRLTGNRADAEDLVQDVCEQALRKAPELATAEDCRRWLLRVLYNRFVDRKRHAKRSPFVPEDTAGAADAATSAAAAGPEELAMQSDSELALARAWARLEPAQQVRFLLRAEGHELDEIARITDTDKPALSSRLHRARSSLAKYLDEEKSAQPLCAVSEKLR